MQSVSSRGNHWRRLSASVALVAVAVAGAAAAEPQLPDTPAALRVAELERLFWHCDWQATTQRLDEGQFTACAAAADELKLRKFGGDFERMIDWWRQHKPAAHAALQAGSVAAVRH